MRMMPKARNTGCTKGLSARLTLQVGSTLSAGPEAACTAPGRYQRRHRPVKTGLPTHPKCRKIAISAASGSAATTHASVYARGRSHCEKATLASQTIHGSSKVMPPLA